MKFANKNTVHKVLRLLAANGYQIMVMWPLTGSGLSMEMQKLVFEKIPSVCRVFGAKCGKCLNLENRNSFTSGPKVAHVG